ncbi:hypothetical protein [Streptomyces sp. cg36]|uniref:hypothetical protein n=1 Tax=Streptomyces sp. cg36 TaxID=3238798 RepID=UPI0034E1BEFD
MTRDGITSETSEPARPVHGICGHWTSAPVVVGHVQSMSGGTGYTHYVCPACVHRYPPRAQWDELPVMRR